LAPSIKEKRLFYALTRAFQLQLTLHRGRKRLFLLPNFLIYLLPERLGRLPAARSFLLKVLFKYVPYIDENVPKATYDTISNRTYSNVELWTKIADDFTFAAAHV